jgi:hypothetical protein
MSNRANGICNPTAIKYRPNISKVPKILAGKNATTTVQIPGLEWSCVDKTTIVTDPQRQTT